MIDRTGLITIGVLLLALVTVEYGGLFVKRVAQGNVPVNELQRSFYRAGHAHAAVLLILSVAITTVLQNADLTGLFLVIARLGVPAAAVLMPAGFFASVAGKDPTRPNRLIVLLWLGVACLTAGLVTAGIGVLVAGLSQPGA